MGPLTSISPKDQWGQEEEGGKRAKCGKCVKISKYRAEKGIKDHLSNLESISVHNISSIQSTDDRAGGIQDALGGAK